MGVSSSSARWETLRLLAAHHAHAHAAPPAPCQGERGDLNIFIDAECLCPPDAGSGKIELL